MNRLTTRVAIVGAGPVGLCLANLLGAEGIATLLLERNPGPHPLPRAQTMDDEGLRTLQAIGLAERFLPMTLRAEGSQYFDAHGDCFARIGPGDEPYGFARRNYMRQERLDALLLDGLARHASVDTRFGTEIVTLEQDARGVRLHGRDAHGPLQVEADYVLACDGGRSRLREALGIRMQGWTYAQDWIVLDALDDP
ncbi:MAG: FAD-dependent monooxygenase, partial [Gammaproteobacteria bacterium]|nr:FAD-dependent monooxygenase [Gammaproteobacteria bacterium]